MILLEKNIWKIQACIATSVIDEEYCLICLITHLIAGFKHATNYVSIDVDGFLVEEIVLKLEAKFGHLLNSVREFFEKCSKIE